MPIIQVTIDTERQQVVPRVPDRAMSMAGWDSGEMLGDTRIIRDLSRAFSAMLSAAPPVPASPVDAFVWRCTQCGELPGIDPAWRWTGEIWQHYHADVGHVDARRFPYAPADARDAERLAYVIKRNWIGTKTRCEHRIEDGNMDSARAAIDAAIAARGKTNV